MATPNSTLKKPANTSHSLSLTGLRGFMALAIIWHHFFNSNPISLKLFNIDLHFLILFPGRITVWLFFIISGYSIYYGFMSHKYNLNLNDSFRFYYNRAIRVLPLFYLLALISWVFFLHISPTALPSWKNILRSLFFININFYDGINAFTPFWFIGVLVHFYIFAPIFVKGYRYIYENTGLTSTFLLLVIVSPLCQYFGYLLTGTYDIRNFVGCLPFFLFGFLAYDLHKDAQTWIQKIFKIVPREIIYLSLIVLLEFSFFMYQYRGSSFFMTKEGLFIKYFGLCWLDGYIGIIGIAMILVLLNKDALLSMQTTKALLSLRKIFRTVLEKMGDQSYGLYMWHSIIITVISKEIVDIGTTVSLSPLSRILFFIAILVITYGVALVFDQFFGKVYALLYKRKKDSL